MKKILGLTLLCAMLFTMLIIGAFAAEKGDYGYYDPDHNGKIEFSEALTYLKERLNNPESDVSLIRVLHSLQAAIASETIAATITSIDTEALTAKISTEFFENVTVPLSVFGLDASANAADYSGVAATIAVHGPASTFADRYDGTVNGFYAAEPNLKFTDTPANASAAVKSMDQLNTNVVDGSHANDSINATTLEMSYRDNAVLSYATTSFSRYKNSYYPRVKKVNDNLYLLLFMYSQTGQHLYYATSSDGTNWNAPEVLWNSADHLIPPYDDTTKRHFAMNADACVLDDGTILCVFAVRDEANYRTNPDGCGLAMVKGTVDENNAITWSAPTGIYTGQVWEPSLLVRDDGQIHVYFTQVAPDIVQYGYDEDHRSTETGLIVSDNNGETWTPDIQPGDENYYRATTVYREYVGDKDDRPHYNGQMPVATQLYNGKIFMAVEIKNLDGTFRISTATSGENGEWDELAVGEEGEYTQLTSNPNSSPYVDRFPSGEIYLTHNSGGNLIGKIGTADGSTFGEAFDNAPGCSGIWGSCSLVGSHKMVTAMQNRGDDTDEDGNVIYVYDSEGNVKLDEKGNPIAKESNAVNVYYHYLNHRINAKKIAINVDGYRNEWALNTDALFVGSESQAQAALQVAHDKDNIHFLINRLDYYNYTTDSASVYIAATDSSYYRIDVGTSKSYTVTLVTTDGTETEVTTGTTAITKYTGTPNSNARLDTGMLTELSVPKSVLGITSATSIKAGFGIANVDSSSATATSDTMVDLTSTVNWPTVILDN